MASNSELRLKIVLAEEGGESGAAPGSPSAPMQPATGRTPVAPGAPNQQPSPQAPSAQPSPTSTPSIPQQSTTGGPAGAAWFSGHGASPVVAGQSVSADVLQNILGYRPGGASPPSPPVQPAPEAFVGPREQAPSDMGRAAFNREVGGATPPPPEAFVGPREQASSDMGRAAFNRELGGPAPPPVDPNKPNFDLGETPVLEPAHARDQWGRAASRQQGPSPWEDWDTNRQRPSDDLGDLRRRTEEQRSDRNRTSNPYDWQKNAPLEEQKAQQTADKDKLNVNKGSPGDKMGMVNQAAGIANQLGMPNAGMALSGGVQLAKGVMTGNPMDMVEGGIKVVQAGVNVMTDVVNKASQKIELIGDVSAKIASNDHMGAFLAVTDDVKSSLAEIPIVGKLFAAEVGLMIAPVKALHQVTDAFITRNRELAQYSGALSVAQSKTETRRLFDDLREAQYTEAGGAKLQNANDDLTHEFRELFLPVKVWLLEVAGSALEEIVNVLRNLKQMGGTVLEMFALGLEMFGKITGMGAVLNGLSAEVHKMAEWLMYQGPDLSGDMTDRLFAVMDERAPVQGVPPRPPSMPNPVEWLRKMRNVAAGGGVVGAAADAAGGGGMPPGNNHLQAARDGARSVPIIGPFVP